MDSASVMRRTVSAQDKGADVEKGEELERAVHSMYRVLPIISLYVKYARPRFRNLPNSHPVMTLSSKSRNLSPPSGLDVALEWNTYDLKKISYLFPPPLHTHPCTRNTVWTAEGSE